MVKSLLNSESFLWHSPTFTFLVGILLSSTLRTFMYFYVSPLLRLQGKSRWGQRGQDRGRVRLKPILNAVLVQDQLSLWTHIGWQGSENVDNRRDFWLWIPPKSQIWPLDHPQNGERATWSWEDNKSRTIATVSDEVKESLQEFLPKKHLQHQFGLDTIAYHIEEM